MNCQKLKMKRTKTVRMTRDPKKIKQMYRMLRKLL